MRTLVSLAVAAVLVSAVTSSSDAWAVGSFYDPRDSMVRTLIEHWNGTSWTVS